MFYYLKFYIKYILYSLFFIALFFALYQISKFQESFVIEFSNYTIYTKQNFIIFTFLLFCYLSFKFFQVLISINSFFISFKYRLFDKVEVLKSYFNFKQKNEASIIAEIKSLKRKKLYKQALRLTSESLMTSQKILFWHLFFLLKLGKRKEFLRIFTSNPSGISIKLFINVYLKKKLSIFQTIEVRRLYLQNPDNQIFTYIYANHLFKKNNIKKAKIILMNFIQNKRILMTDFYCSYLMNLLAIKIEKSLNNKNPEDFTLQYQENIETYYDAKK